MRQLKRVRCQVRVIKITAVSAIGLLILIIGFVYDARFAGIPYQDPTSELLARYEFHRSVAGWFYKVGGILFLVGLLAIPILLNKTQRKDRNKPLRDLSQ